eukprot:5479751-Prymnesium_polylepis.3
MSPLPGWLVGAQSVALNMSNNDLPLHLHFALFNGSNGFVLKPREMLTNSEPGVRDINEADVFWPPPRKQLHCASFDLLSLHQLPK